MKKLKVLELFAGVGGFRKGFVDATKETHHKISFEFVSEWDKHAQDSYEAIWGEKPQGDITQINAVDVPNHDILLAGMPCQAFSIAGKMKGFENPRGALRKMKFMQGIPRYTVTYCQYGDVRMKPTDLWTNHPEPQFKPMCKNGDGCHESAPRGSQTDTQGIKSKVDKARIPKELCYHIAKISENYIG